MLFVYFLLWGVVLFLPVLFFRGVHRVSIIVFAYPLWILAGLALGMPATRIILSGADLYGSYIEVGFYLALFGYALFLFLLFPIRKKFVDVYLPLGTVIRIVLLCCFFFNALLAYPSAMGLGGGRFGTFGGGMIVFYALIFCSRKKDFDPVFILAWILCVWMFSRGERVDFILSVLLPFFVSVKGFRTIGPLKLGVFIAFFIVGLYAGIVRNGVILTPIELLNLALVSVTNFGTAVDVVHVYLSAVWFAFERDASFLPLLNLVASYIPAVPGGGASHPSNFAIFLRTELDNVGGGLFYSMLLPVFGWLGIPLLIILYGISYRFLVTRTGYVGVLFFAFWLMQFRLQWYGLTYFSTVLWLLVLFCLALSMLQQRGFIGQREHFFNRRSQMLQAETSIL